MPTRLIGLTTFALRHFKPDFHGTKILGMTPEEVETRLNELAQTVAFRPGYDTFCVHLIVPNFTTARAGTAPITDANRAQLVSGYVARRSEELPVLERWFEGVEAPTATHLDVILYTREQLVAEDADTPEAEREVLPDTEWCIVAILGNMHDGEDPMSPATMTRNSLGKEQGGSGTPLDAEAYRRGVEFWNAHALVK